MRHPSPPNCCRAKSCSGKRIRGLPIFRLKANRMLTDDEIRELLTKGKTGVLKGFKNKQGKRFDAALVFDADFNTGFVFPERKDGAASAKKRK